MTVPNFTIDGRDAILELVRAYEGLVTELEERSGYERDTALDSKTFVLSKILGLQWQDHKVSWEDSS